MIPNCMQPECSANRVEFMRVALLLMSISMFCCWPQTFFEYFLMLRKGNEKKVPRRSQEEGLKTECRFILRENYRYAHEFCLRVEMIRCRESHAKKDKGKGEQESSPSLLNKKKLLREKIQAKRTLLKLRILAKSTCKEYLQRIILHSVSSL